MMKTDDRNTAVHNSEGKRLKDMKTNKIQKINTAVHNSAGKTLEYMKNHKSTRQKQNSAQQCRQNTGGDGRSIGAVACHSLPLVPARNRSGHLMMMMGIKVMMMVVAMVEIDSSNDDMWKSGAGVTNSYSCS